MFRQARFTTGAPHDEEESPDDPDAPVIGETDADYEPEEADQSNPTAPHSELDLRTLIHWRDALTNSAKNKWKFNKAVEHLSWKELEHLKALQADATDVIKEWKYHGISHAEQPELANDFAKTFPGGAWYFTRLATMWNISGAGDFVRPTGPGSDRNFQTPTLAFHSTSVENCQNR